MANTNGDKYALTALFPIKGDDHYEKLRQCLRDLDKLPLGSPLANVSIVHMARFAIIDNLIYQGLPAKRDRLKSRYLLFVCDFDGAGLDPLVGAMSSQMGAGRRQNLGSLRGLPGPRQARSADRVLRALPARDHAVLLRPTGSRGVRASSGV